MWQSQCMSWSVLHVCVCVYVYLTWCLYAPKYDVHVCASLCTCFCFAYWKTFLWRMSFCCCCLYYILRTNSEAVIGVKITNWTTLYISLKYIRVWVACFPNLSHYTLNSQFFFVVCSVELLRVKWWVWVLLNESIWSNDKPNGKLPNHEINLEIWCVKNIMIIFSKCYCCCCKQIPNKYTKWLRFIWLLMRMSSNTSILH